MHSARHRWAPSGAKGEPDRERGCKTARQRGCKSAVVSLKCPFFGIMPAFVTPVGDVRDFHAHKDFKKKKKSEGEKSE